MHDTGRPTCASVLSIGAATPARGLSRDEAIELGRALAPDTLRPSAISALHRRSGVDTRGVVTDPAMLTARGPSGRGPTTGERLAVFTEHATELACRAGAEALDEAGVDRSSVTHVVTVSCTGMDSPGFDQKMIHRLGLPASARRTCVGFMGCHAAINGLAVAAAFVEADPDAVVLLCCVELCSLHYHFGSRSDQMVANAIFGDGAAAAVIARPVEAGEAPAVTACASTLIPDTEDAMGWSVGDHGFEMTLGPDVPDVLRENVPVWIDSMLAEYGLDRASVGGWAIHPGGPRIVRAVLDGLGLPESAGEVSLDVLRRHGNMSSPTVLFVLREMWRRGTPRPWLGAAFGPGLAGEAVLFT